jgi:hypothetical protein
MAQDQIAMKVTPLKSQHFSLLNPSKKNIPITLLEGFTKEKDCTKLTRAFS